ncbi:hypothetical protein [Streptomyces sp. NRRL WC-3742]|uniref:hypothetical protein n=1 Tax=Streptomyces sp. NRRL WC-3742 TaxID=1463934 RepID=UPI0004C818AD|nr:hypothetical protein [Streptomyces sp. NRRL WC-3742]
MRLALTARHLLHTGATPAEAYASLARRTRDPLRAARAVCAALTIPAAEANRRLDDCYHALLANPRPNSEHDTGELLEALGVFDVPKHLDDRERAIVDLFHTAIDALGGIRAGHHHGLTRWITTGNLTTAYLSLTAATPLPRTGDPTHYWTTLTTAGELLTTTPNPDPRLTYALIQCRLNATRAAR